MIKIKPYTELPQKDEIFNLYLYLVSKSMPFYPEDVFPEGFYFPDGKTKTNLICYNRQSRRRTDAYKSILNDNDYKEHIIPNEATIEERKKNDALLAEAIIKKYSKELHNYLYRNMKDGHVNPSSLRQILKSSVSYNALQKLPFVSDALKANDKEKENILKHVFRYEAFSAQKEIYHLVSLMGVEICPYCNRLFVTTVSEEKKKMRPQLDHYRSKSQYPFLALSILNLVPCCGVCNHIKGDNTSEILYPYEEEMGNQCYFSVDAKHDLTVLTGARINHEELTIDFKLPKEESPLKQHIQSSIELLNLKEVYQSHRRYVSDMLLQRYIFTDEMVRDIKNSFPTLFKTEEEVRELLLLNKLDPDHLGDRPLGKLTHDILDELDFLYEKSKE